MQQKQSLYQTLSNGLNTFNDFSFRTRKIHKRVKTQVDAKVSQSAIHTKLEEYKWNYNILNTQIKNLRDSSYNQFIRRSIKYQELLDINQFKKKRLVSMNKKVGQIIKKQNDKNIVKEYKYQSLFGSLKIQGWKPETREGHTTIIYNHLAIVIGGHCSNPFSKINAFNFSQNSWIKPMESVIARSYHTSNLYKNRYVITFGGMGVYNTSRKYRQCFNNICLLDLLNYKTKILTMKNEEAVQPRRSHSATLVGNHLIVYGGISSNKSYLKSMVQLDLKQLKWNVKQYNIDGIELMDILSGGLAGHQAVSIFKAERKKILLYNPQYSQNEGIYVFGGKNKNNIQNIIFQITFNKITPILKKVSYSGVPPSSVDPLVSIHSENSIIIVSGDQYNRQISLYQIKQQNFKSVVCSSPNLMGIGSSMVQYEENYYLFFGMNEEGYLSKVNYFHVNVQVTQYEVNKKKKPIQNQFKSLQNLGLSALSQSQS